MVIAEFLGSLVNLLKGFPESNKLSIDYRSLLACVRILNFICKNWNLRHGWEEKCAFHFPSF